MNRSTPEEVLLLLSENEDPGVDQPVYISSFKTFVKELKTLLPFGTCCISGCVINNAKSVGATV